jgi:hypothetical protein
MLFCRVQSSKELLTRIGIGKDGLIAWDLRIGVSMIMLCIVAILVCEYDVKALLKMALCPVRSNSANSIERIASSRVSNVAHKFRNIAIGSTL